jgi:hypothetical protein
MHRTVWIVAFVLSLACTSAFTKTINPPSADVADVIHTAREYLKTRHIDLSHRFLAAVEYKNIHSEYERPYWLLTWALLAGTSEGQLYMRVFNTGEIDVSCADKRLCPPGV